MCPSCGNLRSECSNEDADWYPRMSTCWATASQEWALRRLQARYPRDEDGDESSLHPLDGGSVWVSRHPFAPGEVDPLAD